MFSDSDQTNELEGLIKEEMKAEEFKGYGEEIKTDYYSKFSYKEEKKSNYSPY